MLYSFDAQPVLKQVSNHRQPQRKTILGSLRREESGMTYYGATELARSFRTVRNNTIKIAEEIPEETYGFRPAEGCRSIAETLVHIAVMPRVQ
jgi:hypothetical protein